MKAKVFFLFASLFVASAASMASPFARYKDMLKADKYANFSSVILLDSTNVSVQPTGQGAFSVVKAIKVQDMKGVMLNRVIKYDYDPLTAAAKFKQVRIYYEDGTYTEVDVNKTCDLYIPRR